MKFEKTPPTWNAEGSEPPSSLKTSGFQAGYKPPAAYFNWFWNKVSACLTELQTKLSNVDNTKDADKSVKYASTSGSANKTKGSMVVRLNGGSTEGTDLFTFNGSTGKSVNITPAKIGAASESKLPFWATYGTTTNAEIEAAYQAGNQVLVKTTDGYVGELFARLSSGKAHFFCAGVKIYRCFNGNWTDLSDSYGFTPTVHASTHKKGGSDPIKPEDIGAAAASNGTVLSQNADYAEVGQWADGNPNNENRIGYFVAIDDTQAGTTIIKATSTKDVRGVVVTAPAFSGNGSADKFDSNGNLLKQYAYVAVMGLVSVIDNGTCTINERCMPNDSGTAVPSSNNLGYQVIDRIDDTHILIAVEPGADMIQRIRTDVAGLQNDVANRVRYDVAQSLTDDQKTQARTNINAAPDGFGLGNIGKLLTPEDNLDEVKTNGWYRWERKAPPQGTLPSVIGQSMDATLIRVWGNGAVCYQESINITDDTGHGCLCARTIYASIIYPWEWVNPLMQTGVEYRTTERFWGKPVYYKIVDCGQIADNKQVEHGIVNMRDCISFQGLRGGMPMPSISNNNLSDPWSFYVADVSRTKITLACGTSAAGGNCHVMLKYTKTTD